MSVANRQAFQLRLKTYRERTFRTTASLRLRSLQDARQFVEERGFVLFWPHRGHEYPSLWAAAAGDRPVPDDHDDPGHITWSWKDEALDQRIWYYARLIRRRNTMVSLECAPYFYALSPNYGDPENDYLEQYKQGVLTAEAKAIYETLLHQGPLDRLSLRRVARLSSQASDSRFSKALDDLMMEMKIIPVGISQAGGWHYAFIYDLVVRHFPDLQDKARSITEAQARKSLLMKYYQSMGAAELAAACRLFQWQTADATAAMRELLSDGHLVHATRPDNVTQLLALPKLMD
ncbi:MAG: hypothetical protein HPY76_05870 [Anaerolineae bacterium]|nr:hypothetical protein [Anaerolineae bacterium]